MNTRVEMSQKSRLQVICFGGILHISLLLTTWFSHPPLLVALLEGFILRQHLLCHVRVQNELLALH